MSEVIIITGGSRGIGAACAERLSEPGRTIVINYVSNSNAAAKVATTVNAKGGTAVTVQGDVASEKDVLRLFEEADKHGTLSGLVNNAGVVDFPAKVLDMSHERISRIMNTNVIGAMVCAREAALRMSKERGGDGGTIINISSVAAHFASPNQYVDYAASKGAIDVFTKGLALEMANDGVRVVAVRPGVIDTDIHASGGQPDRARELRDVIPMKREGKASEIAEAVAWLMSDKAAYVTSAFLDVSGGR